MQRQLALLFAAAVAASATAQSKVSLYVGDPAPPLKIAKWAKGQPVAQVGNGKVSVVEFWATWCGPCRESIPHLTKLAEKYAGKVTFVGVDSFEHNPDPATCYPKVEKFVADMGDKMNYHVAIDGVDGTMAKTWMVAAGQGFIPTAFIVGKDGKIAWIGSPGQLDDVLGPVLDGSFDVKAESEKEKLAVAKQQEEMAKQQQAQEAQNAILKPLSDAQRANDYKGEVAAIDSISAKHPEYEKGLEFARFVALSHYDPNSAIVLVQKIADQAKGNSQALNQIAWTIVEDNSPVGKLNPAVALKIAKAAYASSNEDPNVADTLALAYYRAGDTTNAIKFEDIAVTKAAKSSDVDANSLAEMKQRLQMFKKPIKAL